MWVYLGVGSRRGYLHAAFAIGARAETLLGLSLDG
jgi:hypothetical protein